MNRNATVLAITVAVMFMASVCNNGSAAMKTEYPVKGKAITIIVPGPAGGGNDVAMRALIPDLEPLLGTTIRVVNKPGAAQQLGNTELSQSKADGYTLGYPSLPTLVVQYLDPQRKAVFKRDSFQSVAVHVALPLMIAVRKDSPFKTVTDLVEAAKAKPNGIKGGCADRLDQTQLAWHALEKLTGTQFAVVNFKGGNEQITSLLGGHVDAQIGNSVNFMPNFKSGQFRILGIMDKQMSNLYPGVKTMESQGYPMYELSARVVLAPSGTPKETVTIISAAIKKAMETESHKKKAVELGMELRYMGPDELNAYWNEVEVKTKDLMQRAIGR